MATLVRAGPAHAAVLTALHDSAFDSAWKEDAFRTLLALPGVFALIVLDSSEQPAGLVMMRETVDEAEVLTLCTRPDRRRSGLARRLLREAFRSLDNSVTRCFVEVAEDNAAARALYESAGYRTVGVRAGYYETDRGRIDALVMVLEGANGNQLQIA